MICCLALLIIINISNHMETEVKISPRRKKEESGNRVARAVMKKSVFIAAIILILALFDTHYNVFSALREKAAAKGKWQAVFLASGQVYFGHLSSYGWNSFALTDIYYIRSFKAPAAQAPEEKNGKTAEPQQPPQETRNELVKMTDDPHGPENTMFIPKTHILFWQNLRNDSQVVATIQSAKK